jgi:DNA-binding SARP family transcriptional activator
VADLRRLVAEHPLREHIRAQLMSACYHSGLQAEALAVYRDARETLVSELGVEPGPELREMHRRILTADPEVSEDERAQLTRLRTENARLASELDVLKRTSAGQLR